MKPLFSGDGCEEAGRALQWLECRQNIHVNRETERGVSRWLERERERDGGVVRAVPSVRGCIGGKTRARAWVSDLEMAIGPISDTPREIPPLEDGEGSPSKGCKREKVLIREVPRGDRLNLHIYDDVFM